MTARLTIEYDGTDFAGWARQPGLRTVQGEIEDALAALRGRGHGGERVELTVAGRTDRGVHALAQVASHPGDPAPLDGLNALLPRDVAVTASDRVADAFDARRDAVSRTYCYKILTRRPRSAFDGRRALHWPHAIDREALDACAQALVGTHDFTAFTPTITDHVRFDRNVLAARWETPDEHHLEFWITADAFMRHMNRVLIGTMLQVAGRRRSLGAFVALLEGRPRAEAGPTAPPHGLYFAGVGY